MYVRAQQAPALWRTRAPMTESDPKPRLLILDEDRILRLSVASFLTGEGYDVRQTGSLASAFDMLATRPAEVLIVDLHDIAPHDAEADALLRRLRKEHPETVVVVATGYGSIEQAVRATKAGAFEYLTKPVIDDEIRIVVERAVRQQALLHENRSLRQQLDTTFGLDSVVGRHDRMKRIFDLVDAVADSRTTVLIQGESGTGKSLLARALHRRSSRSGGPFVEVSCGALPEQLLESELFGHVKGAFTGAMTDKPGRFAAAEGGTLFLDEINSASPAMQVKLLRVLQEKLYEPVGSHTPREADVRIVLASNVDLAELVATGGFRQDLFYRINIVKIEMPALRERMSDVPLLAEHFLAQFRDELGRNLTGFTPDAAVALQRYDWPGNIRELENAVERAAVLCRKMRIDMGDLPETVRGADGEPAASATASGGVLPAGPMPLRDALELPERAIILAALERNAWNRQATAAELQINRTTLYKKMRHFRLDAAPVE